MTNNSPVQHGAMDFTDPPTDLDAVRLYRLGRIRAELARHDYAGILLFDPVNTRYATDCTNMQIWCTHYEARCVLVMADGPTILFEYSDLPHLSAGLPTIDEVRVLSAFYYFTAGSRASEWASEFGRQINDVMRDHAGGNRRLAIDRLSHLGVDAIRSQGIEVFDGQEVTETARSIKSPGEIALMESSIEVCHAGMDAMRDALQPGVTENALWAQLHETNIRLGGEWIETRLLASGPRTNPWYHECSMRVIEEGDMVSFDTDLIGPYGYCADISRAWVCGDNPSPEQRRIYGVAHEQIQHNIDLLRPGVGFREFAESSWEIPAEFVENRYSCIIHGIGLADEWPSIPPQQDFERFGYDGVFEPGMTICVESFIGSKGGTEGVKLEQMILITPDGNRLLSTYPFESSLS